MGLLYKMWKKCKILVESAMLLALIAVFPVGIITYMYFTVPKFKKGDCLRMKYNDFYLLKVTSVHSYRYKLNNSTYLGIEYVDKNARKVKCEQNSKN